jgi:hypothetical protein
VDSCSSTGEGDVSVVTKGSSRLSRWGKARISNLFLAKEKNPDGQGSASGAAVGSFGLMCWA